MAQNFRVRFKRSSDSLHLHLAGEFDGSSACMLAHTLETHCSGTERIVVHTDGLTGPAPLRTGRVPKSPPAGAQGTGHRNLHGCQPGPYGRRMNGEPLLPNRIQGVHRFGRNAVRP